MSAVAAVRGVQLGDEPTDRQREIYDFMIAYQLEWGMPPTLREIRAHFGVASTYTAYCHLVALKKRGLVRHRKGTSRAWLAIQPPLPEGTNTCP